AEQCAAQVVNIFLNEEIANLVAGNGFSGPLDFFRTLLSEGTKQELAALLLDNASLIRTCALRQAATYQGIVLDVLAAMAGLLLSRTGDAIAAVDLVSAIAAAEHYWNFEPTTVGV